MSVLEHLPGEPEHKGPPRTIFAIRVLLRLGSLVVIAIVAWPLWILYVLAALIWGWPPNVPRCGQVIRYLRLTWTVSPPAPGLRKLSRCWITLSVIRKVLLTPIWGLAWLLDEMLYGRALDAAPLTSPLIEIAPAQWQYPTCPLSGARSSPCGTEPSAVSLSLSLAMAFGAADDRPLYHTRKGATLVRNKTAA